ncbi:MAG: hypothetical protein IPG63_04900 [Xanthomonadales bacterium]|nr:hypothetical protein [Xanthomonadales bacterium]MBK7144996.1 hypothetical protein [Xanthomonadales bacterium]MBK7147184.1 hypothetical protein [Xanthomonadales bacterium]
MPFLFAGLSGVCLIIVFTTHSPGLLGLALFGCATFALMAVFAFAHARIESTRQHDTYLPSPEELELIRRAEEKRRQIAARNSSRNDDEQEQA